MMSWTALGELLFIIPGYLVSILYISRSTHFGNLAYLDYFKAFLGLTLKSRKHHYDKLRVSNVLRPPMDASTRW